MKWMLFLILLTSSLSNFASDKFQVVNALLDAEIKATEKHLKVKSLPTLHFRLLNLLSEKSKVIKDFENDQYLKSVEKGENKSKDSFGQQSLAFAKKADEAGLNILKLFPQYQRLGEVFFILGMNDRDYSKGQKAENYFNQSLKHLPKASPIIFEVKSALADFYYNEKKYQKAIALYEEILQEKNQTWWTKYAYHYAWCLLKVEQYPKALNMMLTVYEKSKKSQAINMNKDIIANVGLFFYYAKELDQSLVFYKKESKDNKEALSYGLKMANLLLKKGHLKEAKDYFLAISNLATEADDKFGVLSGLLSLHHEKREFSDFNRVVSEMENLNPKQELKEDFIYQLKLAIKDGQEILGRKKENTELAHTLVHFYEVIGKFDVKEFVPSLFYSGEIYYQANLNDKARDKYKTCVLSSSAASIKFAELCFDSLEAVVAENEKTNPSVESQKLYSHYLTLLPQGKLASILWRRLFLVYLKEKSISKLSDLISTYHINFPQDLSFQKDMMTKLLTLVIDLKETAVLEKINSKLETGFLDFDREFKNKSWDVLGNMKLADIQGKTPSAETLAQAQMIYDTKQFNQAIRIKASYNMAVALFHLEKTKEANVWLLKTLSIMSQEDLNKSFQEIPGFLLGYFNLHDKASLITLADFVVGKYCSVDEKKAFEIVSSSVQYLLVDKYLDESLEFYKKTQSCFKEMAHKESIESEFFRHTLETHNTHTFFQLAKLYHNPHFFDYLLKFSLSANEEAFQKINELKTDPAYQDVAYFKKEQALVEYGKVDQALSGEAFTLLDLEQNFNEEELMSRLQQILKKLTEEKMLVNNFYQFKQAEYSLSLTKKLAAKYQAVIKSLADFKPVIADKEYRGTLLWSIRTMRKNLEKEETVITKKIAGVTHKQDDFFKPWDLPVVLGLKIPQVTR